MLGEWWSGFRNYLYDKELLPIVHSGFFVVSVGNLTWGGTGKTALTSRIGSFLLSRGYRVAVLSRGYKRASSGVQVVSDGNQVIDRWESAGEESYWLAKKLPGAVVVVAENRLEALPVLRSFQPHILLLDDAFQHRRIARNLDLVLLDASENLLSEGIIPFGKLREPLSSLQRADAVVLTHTRLPHTKTFEWLSQHVTAPIFQADYEPQAGGVSWNGKRVAAFCAIGAPHHFFDMLERNGAELVLRKRFRDHHHYSKEDMASLDTRAQNAGAQLLVTTEKDAVKISDFPFQLPFQVAAVELKLKVEDLFFQFLLDRFLEYAVRSKK